VERGEQVKSTAYTQEQLDRVIGQIRASELPLTIQFKPYKDTRSNEQNRRMWAMLRDVSQQVDWYGKKLTSQNWKDVFTASLRKQEVVPGIDGGFVILGQSTSKMTIAAMCELTELMYAFGAEHDVVWSDPADVMHSER
jgi:hypothetical protein